MARLRKKCRKESPGPRGAAGAAGAARAARAAVVTSDPSLKRLLEGEEGWGGGGGGEGNHRHHHPDEISFMLLAWLFVVVRHFFFFLGNEVMRCMVLRLIILFASLTFFGVGGDEMT